MFASGTDAFLGIGGARWIELVVLRENRDELVIPALVKGDSASAETTARWCALSRKREIEKDDGSRLISGLDRC
jgi:hypothetical protein